MSRCNAEREILISGGRSRSSAMTLLLVSRMRVTCSHQNNWPRRVCSYNNNNHRGENVYIWHPKMSPAVTWHRVAMADAEMRPSLTVAGAALGR